MKKIIFLVLIFVAYTTYAQNYNFSQYERQKKLAQYYDSLEEYDSAIAHYDAMLSTIGFYPYDYFEAFETAWKQRNINKANHYLTQGTLTGLDISRWYSKNIDEFLATKSGLVYLKIKDSLLNVHFENIDKVYFDSLVYLVEIDQKNRDGGFEMIQNDSLNFEALIRLSEQKGFPTFPETGYGCNKAWLLLWHHRGESYPNSNQWQRIIPLIEIKIREGLLKPDFLKMFDDYEEQ